jgi:membrane fusion protein, copper/silver efflux system
MLINKNIVWRVAWATLATVAVVGAVISAATWWPTKENLEAIDEETWTCSMHPQIRRPGPGQCPICGMNLIPVAQLAAAEDSLASIGVATESIGYRELAKELRTVGKLEYSESQIAYITARIDGRVDRVFADIVGTEVKKGDHLVAIYSPKLNVDQSSLIQAVQDYERLHDRQTSINLDATRERLRLLGILPEQIEQIERTRKTSNYLTLYSPIGGTIIEKSVRPGQYVSQGDVLYRIASLDPIWLLLDIYESDLAWIRHGQHADVTLEAYPGEVFRGTVSFIDPFLNDQTRTVKVRVTLKNADRRLKPAMYASAVIKVALGRDGRPLPTGLEGKFICPMHPDVVKDEQGHCPICGMDLVRVPIAPTAARPSTTAPMPNTQITDHSEHIHLDHAGEHKEQAASSERSEPVELDRPNGVLAVRASAVLDTGKRQVVYRKNQHGAFELVAVQLGPRSTVVSDEGRGEDFFPVVQGLNEGDEVVFNGAFLLDSQRQFEGMPSLLYAEGRSASSLHSGHTSASSGDKPAEAEHKH